MTIEEKAKAYDEALEIAKGLYAKDAPDSLHLERMFPELRESEDERIRKALIKLVKKAGEGYENVIDGVSIKDALAWLEKQGNLVKYYEDKLDRCACDNFNKGYKKALEKQSEQKPNYCHHEVDLSNCSEEYRKAYYDGWNNCNQQHAQLKAEQKSAGWLDKILRDTDFYENEIELLLKEFKKAMSEKCNESNHVFIKGDVIKNKVTEKQYLVIKVEGNTFLLGDAICPQFGYKKEVTISPLYVFVKHLSEKEFKDIMNRCL